VTSLRRHPDIGSAVRGALDLVGFDPFAEVRGARVVIKPNLLVPKDAATGATTHLEVVAELVSACRRAGADVTIVESSNWGIDTDDVFAALGYKRLADETGCHLVNLKKDELRSCAVPGWRVNARLRIPQAVLGADFIINVPVLKAHRMTHVTLSLKNISVGIMSDDQKESAMHAIGGLILPEEMRPRGSWLDHAIVDVNSVARTDLVVVDGLVGMEGPGAPLSGPPVGAGLIVAGRNRVAVDVACCRLMGQDPALVAHLRLAQGAGLGPARLDDVELVGDAATEGRPFAPAVFDSYDFNWPAGVEMEDHGGCYACRSSLRYFVERHREPLEALAPITFYTGVPPRRSIRRERRHLIFFGNCTLRTLYGGGFVAGCPPRSRRQVLQALGAVDFYVADEQAETCW
jgi:uncharacterized protein (DUF362 family)